MKIKALIFDLDRTLLDLKQAEITGLEQLLSTLNINLEINEFYEVYSKFNEYWWQQRSIGKANSDDVRKNRFRDTFQKFGIELSISFSELNDRYFSIASQFWILYPDVHENLSQLKSRDFKLAIITNGFTDTQKQKITHLGIADYFDFICLSEETGFTKPDHRIFHFTCDQLNVMPEESIYIGDDYNSDIIGAQNANLKAIWFNEHQLENPDGVLEFKSFKEFDSILENVLK